MPIHEELRTISDDDTLGMMCLRRMWPVPAPRVTAASTYHDGCPLDKSRVDRHEHHCHGNDAVDEAGTEYGRHRQRQQDSGEREHQVDQAHYHEVNRAAENSRDQADCASRDPAEDNHRGAGE
jgi:hypothetical protein